jgi:hypothetical protein
MKAQTYIDTNGNIVATGTISINLIDLVLSDGTRFFSTRSDNYTLVVLKNLNINKIVKGLKYMENKKMVIDDLTYDEVGLLCTALKTTIIKMKELEVPEFFIETAISLFNQVEVILDTKVAEQKTFIELINDQLDDVAIASEIIEKNPDVVIPEYK